MTSAGCIILRRNATLDRMVNAMFVATQRTIGVLFLAVHVFGGSGKKDQSLYSRELRMEVENVHHLGTSTSGAM